MPNDTYYAPVLLAVLTGFWLIGVALYFRYLRRWLKGYER